MPETIEARVFQKTDTLENWMANSLVLGKGEQAFVVNSLGQPINFKIGDGTKIFSALPWWIDYAASVVVPTVAPGALPSPTGAGKLMVLQAGTYTQTTGPNIVSPASAFNMAFWDGTTWSLVVSIAISATGMASTQDLINATQFNGVIGAVDAFSTYTSTTDTSERTRFNAFNTATISGALATAMVKVYKTGNLVIEAWRKVTATTYTLVASQTVACVVGTNTFNLTGFNVQVGDYLGFSTPTGGALVSYKTVALGAYSSTTNNPNVGDTLTFAASNTEFAINAVILGTTVKQDITTLKANSVTTADLTLTTTSNLANESYRLADMYVATSTGAKVRNSGSVGWSTFRIPVPVGASFMTFGNFSVDTNANAAFYGSADDPTIPTNGTSTANYIASSVVGFTNADLPKTVAVPSGAAFLYVSVKRPANNLSDSANTIINVGSSLVLPYAPPVYVSKIKGNPIFVPTTGAAVATVANADRLEYRSTRKAIISFIFDDLNASDAQVYSIFKEFGFRPSFALKTGNLNGSNAPTYKAYWQDGCSILNHTVTHQSMSNGSMDMTTANNEIVNAKKAINAYGMMCSGFVTPFSVMNSIYYPIVDRVQGYAFTMAPDTGACNTTVAPNRLSRYGIEGTDTAGEGNSLAAIKTRIDTAISNKQLLFLYGHQLPSTTIGATSGLSYLTETKLRDILTYLKTYADNYDCMVLNSDDAVKTYYTKTWAENYGA